MAEELIIKGVAGTISFGIVGVVFNCLNWFDKYAMKIVYTIVSIILSFIFCVIIDILNKYWYILLILLAIILIVTILLIRKINKRKEKVEGYVITNS